MISVIIPCYNAEKTLTVCLEAIFRNSIEKFEVIVVDDGSTDSSKIIAEKFPCRVINLATNRGPGAARNHGVLHAAGDIIVFIDADVVVGNKSLSIIHHFLQNNKEVHGVVGMLDQHCPYGNFYSQYKNLYMNYIFSKLDSEITFIYSSLYAVRKSEYLQFDESLAAGEDTELGLRLSTRGKKIKLLKDLTVTHLKEHYFYSIMKNDFLIPFVWAQLFCRYSNPLKTLGKKKFAHARTSQILSVLISPAAVISLFLSPFLSPVFYWFSVFLLFLFVMLNIDFLTFLSGKKGLPFLLKSILFTFADQVIMFAGITMGMLKYLLFRYEKA